MKSKILSAVFVIAMLAFASNVKASTVTINPGISYITFYPSQGGDPFVLYSTGNVPDGGYDVVVQVAGSFAINGHVIRSWNEVSGFDPFTFQPIYTNYNMASYPDNDPYSPTFGQANFYSVIVNSYNDNSFRMNY